MRLWKRLLYCAIGLFGIALFVASCYGMGEDIFNIFPLAVSKILLGLVTWCIVILIWTVFIVGIFRIVDWVKRSVE